VFKHYLHSWCFPKLQFLDTFGQNFLKSYAKWGGASLNTPRAWRRLWIERRKLSWKWSESWCCLQNIGWEECCKPTNQRRRWSQIQNWGEVTHQFSVRMLACKIINVKSLPSHKAHRVVLIYVSLALSQALVYTARPRILGKCFARCACLHPSYHWYLLRLTTDGWPG